MKRNTRPMFRTLSFTTIPVTGNDYKAKIRAGHALADLLKRTRPRLSEQVLELQTTLRHCQMTLDQAQQQLREAQIICEQDAMERVPNLSPETLAALRQLDETTQSLLDLRHCGQACS